MGQAPSQPTVAQAAELKASKQDAVAEAAAALFNADVLLLLVGDSVCATNLCATCGVSPQPQPQLEPSNDSSVSRLKGGGGNELSHLNPHLEPEAFYGFYGDEFNRSRETPPNPAYDIVQHWVDRRFTGTAADVAMQTAMKDALRSPLQQDAVASAMATDTAALEETSQNMPSLSEAPHTPAEAAPSAQATGWQAQSVLCAWGQAGPAGQLDLTQIADDDDGDKGDGDDTAGKADESGSANDSDSSDSDDDAAANRPFDAHAPNMPGAFHVFTSVADGHASKLFGAHCVRECRGSLQLWQCGATSGPCRDSDAWEAPDGFFFRTSTAASRSPDCCTPSHSQQASNNTATVAPPGLPKSTPPFHVVPMHHGSCMGRALSVAQAFRTNHPKCRSCGSAPSRPAMPLALGCASGSSGSRGGSNSNHREGSSDASGHVNSDENQTAGDAENDSEKEAPVEPAGGVSVNEITASTSDGGGRIAADWAWADLDDRRVRYQAWRKLAVARAAAQASGGQDSGRVVLLEIGAFHACTPCQTSSEFETKEETEVGEEGAKARTAVGVDAKAGRKSSTARAISAHAPWVTVRRESEAFLRDFINAGSEGTSAVNECSSSSSSSSDHSSVSKGNASVTLVRINEAYPLLDRRDKELQDDERVRVVSIMQPVLEALRAIDDALVALERNEAEIRRSAQ